jgi:hypothetical protein
VVATSHAASSRAAVDWTLKQKCCLTASARVSARSDAVFSVTKPRFRNYREL